MLKKITKLRNVSLFQNGTPTPLIFDKVTLVYGENGRGKSTIASILKSCAENRNELITGRKTIGETDKQQIELIFSNNFNATFDSNNGWSKNHSNTLVFDSHFVDENAYTGQKITTDNRRGLYEFALGSAVAIQEKMKAATDESSAASKDKQEKEKTLNTHTQGMTLKKFIDLPVIENADKKITILRETLNAISSLEAIKSREVLKEISIPNIEIPRVISVLQKTIDDIEKNAEDLYKSHTDSYKSKKLQKWISDGYFEFLDEKSDSCPFCSQQASNSEIIKSYKTLFNTAYKSHISEITAINNDLEKLSLNLEEGIVDKNLTIYNVWIETVKIPKDISGIDDLSSLFAKLKRHLCQLVSDKLKNPLEILNIDIDLNGIYGQINQIATDYNKDIKDINQCISSYKSNLDTSNSEKIRTEIKTIELSQKRHSDAINAVISEYRTAESIFKEKSKEKDNQRKIHDEYMENTLKTYQAEINNYLEKFHARFKLVELEGKHTAGQPPRTSYVIEMRGTKISNLEGHKSSELCFSYILSEGDKRTLALAFFLARIKKENNKGNLIIVLDDPVTSLDNERRKEIIDEFIAIIDEVEQVIIMSHDYLFLNSVRLKVHTHGSMTYKSYKISSYGQYELSQFTECDLHNLSQSEYERHYHIINDFLNSESPISNKKDVCFTLRLLVEGYYKIRYPNRIDEFATFGKIIKKAEDDGINNPLSALLPIKGKLEDFNEFASQFHHSNGVSTDHTVSDIQLRKYCEIALNLIHNDGRDEIIV